MIFNFFFKTAPLTVKASERPLSVKVKSENTVGIFKRFLSSLLKYSGKGLKTRFIPFRISPLSLSLNVVLNNLQ